MVRLRLPCALFLADVRCGDAAAQEPESKEEADRQLPRMTCSDSSVREWADVLDPNDPFVEVKFDESFDWFQTFK